MLHRYLSLPLVVALGVLSSSAVAEDARSIIDKLRETQAERRQGVTDYIVDQATMGRRVVSMFERVSVTVDGEKADTFRMVPLPEIEQRRASSGEAMTPSQLEAYADAQEKTGEALKDEIERGMEDAGLPPGLLGAMGAASADEPWASPDPSRMMGASAEMMRETAQAQRTASDGTEEAQESMQSMADFGSNAKLVGTEEIDRRPAYHLRADGLERRQAMEDGGEFVVNTVSLWIDKEKYVPLRMTTSGTMTQDNETRDIQIEQLYRDYRPVEGSDMYEPYRLVMRLGGVMTEAQKQELAQAQAELEKLQLQLDSMPESQKDMVERMIGPQLATVRKMAAGGGLEVVTEVHEIRVNSGLPGQDELARKTLGAE